MTDPATKLDRDLALIEALNALALIVECLESPLGHSRNVKKAASIVASAMRHMGAVDEPDGAACPSPNTEPGSGMAPNSPHLDPTTGPTNI